MNKENLFIRRLSQIYDQVLQLLPGEGEQRLLVRQSLGGGSNSELWRPTGVRAL